MMKLLSDTAATRRGMIETCLWMNASRLNQSTSGNISVRTEAGVLITPSGIPYEEITEEMLVLIPHDGPPGDDLAPAPSSEWRFHQAVLKARPDMTVALHAHPPNCSVLAVQRRRIEACHYMIAVFGGSDVPICDYALFGTKELADKLSVTLANRHGCLMANHGAMVLGESLPRARWRLEELEVLARTFLFSHLGGTPHILSDAEITEVLDQFEGYGPNGNA